MQNTFSYLLYYSRMPQQRINAFHTLLEVTGVDNPKVIIDDIYEFSNSQTFLQPLLETAQGRHIILINKNKITLYEWITDKNKHVITYVESV